MVDAACERFGALDILVNNAGIGHLPPARRPGGRRVRPHVAVNMKPSTAAREAVPRMKAAGRGVILNMASTAGVSPRPKLAWYNASKGWVITATRAMAVELAPSASASWRSTRWPARRRSGPSWAATRPRRARSFSPPSRSGASRGRRISATPPASCAATGRDDHRRGDGSGRRALHLNMKTYDIEISASNRRAHDKGVIELGTDAFVQAKPLRDDGAMSSTIRLPVEHARRW